MVRRSRRGYSLIGLLISFACIAVLFALMMSSMNKAITGEGSTQVNTLHSLEDKLRLSGIMQGMIVYANENKERYLVPSLVAGSDDPSLNTTASFYSALIAGRFVAPEQVISGNEFSGYVEQAYDYDYRAYDPASGVYWDPNFKADLHDLSNASFAHLPMFGERFDRNWQQTFSSSFPVLGNRGPENGIDDPQSFTYGRNGRWAGHLVFGDGHVAFVDSFTPGLSYSRDGHEHPDNIFAVEDGPDGGDAILSFTRKMTEQGPELQFD